MSILSEQLWDEYFAEKCAAIETEEEKALIKRTIEKHNDVNAILTDAQKKAVEQYAETVYEMQGLLAKKAFFMGFEFARSFFLTF